MKFTSGDVKSISLTISINIPTEVKEKINTAKVNKNLNNPSICFILINYLYFQEKNIFFFHILNLYNLVY